MSMRASGLKVRPQFVLMMLVWLAGLLFVLPNAALASDSEASVPVVLSFDKSDAEGDGEWTGTVRGGISGELVTRATFIDDANPVWNVEFDFIVGAGDKSMTIRLKGTLDTTTGAVKMDGVVADGYLEGAKVYEEGQLIDATTSRFQGTIRIVPRSSRSEQRLFA